MIYIYVPHKLEKMVCSLYVGKILIYLVDPLDLLY